MRKINLYISFVATMLLSLGALAQNSGEYFTDTLHATAGSVNMKSRTVSINGQTYKYDIDASMSEFSQEEVKQALVDLRDIKPGEKYYFTLYYYGRENENAKIVFVSVTQPMS